MKEKINYFFATKNNVALRIEKNIIAFWVESVQSQLTDIGPGPGWRVSSLNYNFTITPIENIKYKI